VERPFALALSFCLLAAPAASEAVPVAPSVPDLLAHYASAAADPGVDPAAPVEIAGSLAGGGLTGAFH